ncbi:MAG: beta-N-acetylhexosaminidase [Oscillospiraceae bacterium]|nr:beta-N-acetylhexosaminidase [Oscillospiraceae bacterium]
MTQNAGTFRRLGTMIDCSRNAVMRPEEVCRWAKETRELGYNMLMLYTEDVYEIEGYPYFGYGRGRYTREELKRIDAYCQSIGMELIPCIQTLAHLDGIVRWKTFKPYIDTEDILLIDDDRTYALIDAMLRTCAECFTSRVINIGMDEAHMVGHGKYYDLHGDSNRFELLMHHLERVAEIGRKYGFTMLMWSDMFFRLATGGVYCVPDAKIDPLVSERIPDGVELVYWDYYSTDFSRYDGMLAAHDRLKPGAWFAGGLWTWYGPAPHNRYTIETTIPAFDACRKRGVKDVFMTIWGDDGGECSRWAILPSLYYTAMLAKGVTDPDEIKAGFLKRYGVSFDDFMLLDLPGTGSDIGRCAPDKQLLFNDPFLGLYDSTLMGSEAASYRAAAEKLEAADCGAYRLQFETIAALARVLELKADLGQRTRAAYADGKKALKAVADDYDALLPRLERLYEATRAQWLAENRPQGFEVQDIRLGGVIRRVDDCRRTLRAYLAGELERIEELEQPQLDVECGDTFARQPCRKFHRWRHIVSPGSIGM